MSMSDVEISDCGWPTQMRQEEDLQRTEQQTVQGWPQREPHCSTRPIPAAVHTGLAIDIIATSFDQ